MLDELGRVEAALTCLRPPTGVDLLRRFFDVESEYMAAGGADGGADFEPFLPLLAERVVIREATRLPWGGDWVGHDGFRDLFAQMSRAWSSFALHDLELFEPVRGGDRVVASMRQVTTSRVTGQVTDEPMLALAEIRGGLIHHLRAVYYHVIEVDDLITEAQDAGDAD